MESENDLKRSGSPVEMQRLYDGAYDFLDFGCSTGGSISFAQKYLGGSHGLGLDINSEKVKLTQANGFDAISEDILSINANDASVS